MKQLALKVFKGTQCYVNFFNRIPFSVGNEDLRNGVIYNIFMPLKRVNIFLQLLKLVNYYL